MFSKKTFLTLLFAILIQFGLVLDAGAVGLGGSCATSADCDQGLMCSSSSKECIVVLNIGGTRPKTGSIEFEKGEQLQQVEIPGLDPITSVGGDFVALKTYISAIYRVGMGITGILAVVVLALGGITWLTSGGNANQITKAKQYIWGSMTGLILALLSYTLLYTVNPDIVALKTGGSVTALKGAAIEGCSWSMTKCDISYQVESPENYCGEKPPQIGGESDLDYKYCCCKKGDSEGCCVKYIASEVNRDVLEDCFWTTLSACDDWQENSPATRTNFIAGTLCTDVESCASLGLGSICTNSNYGVSCGDNKVCVGGRCVDCIPEGGGSKSINCYITGINNQTTAPCCSGLECKKNFAEFGNYGTCK